MLLSQPVFCEAGGHSKDVPVNHEQPTYWLSHTSEVSGCGSASFTSVTFVSVCAPVQIRDFPTIPLVTQTHFSARSTLSVHRVARGSRQP